MSHIEVISHKGSVIDLSVSMDGRYIVSLGADRYIVLYDLISNRILSVVVDPRVEPQCLCLSPDSKYLAVGMNNSQIDIWDTSSLRLVGRISNHGGSTVTSIAWGKYIASGSEDKTIKIWDPTSKDCLAILRGHASKICCLDWLADRDYLVSGGADSKVILWNVSLGKAIAELSGHIEAIKSVVFADEETIVSCCGGGIIRFWSIRTLRPTRAFKANCKLTCMSYEPRSKIIALGCNDGNIVILGGELKLIKVAHSGSVTSIKWLANGQMLASGGEDGKVMLWKLN